MAETQFTFCRICESLCGLEVSSEHGRITQIRPDAEHVATRGFGCVKGLKQHELFASPDRLRHPLKRVGGRLEPIPWQQALGEIGQKVQRLRADHGPDSIAMYVGTAAGFGFLHPIFAQGFMTGIGSKSMYSSATQDCSNKFAVAREIYGFPFTQPFPDLEHTDCLIVVGANPVVSKWSFLQVPNPGQHLREIEARGGHVYFVDPRRTESAKTAGTHVAIRPGTDVFFYLSFLSELDATGGVDRAQVDATTRGFEAVRALAARFGPERTADVTRIAPDTLRQMVAHYREADGAVLYSSTGVNMGGSGALAFWLQEVINVVSGNFDRRGGSLIGRGILDFAKLGARTGFGLRDDRSRVGGFRSVNDGFPGAVLADEILTQGPGQIRALFVTGGNPLITMANAGRLRTAFEKLELLVTLDIFPNETGSLAHYLLPATSPLERPDLPFAFPLLMGMQSRPYLQATAAVVTPDGEQCDEASIYLALARACRAPLFGSKVAQRILEWSTHLASQRGRGGLRVLPQERLLSLVLRLTRNGSFAKLLAEPHGRRRPAHPTGETRANGVRTPDGRIDLAPKGLLAGAEKLDALLAHERATRHELRLIGRRHVKTHNSWTHNHPEFVRGELHTNYLYMHPEDAKAAGLRHGDLADVRTDVATVRVPIRLLPDLQPGTVALPHGWGHQHAPGLRVASATAGVNVNLLTGDGPENVDPLSGMSRLTALPVEVRRAAGPKSDRSWSGL